MNIFVLDKNPALAAQYHMDKHVVKMPLETAQILCSVRHKLGLDAPYKLTHKNHPCVVWAEKSLSNYFWLCKLGLEISQEYTYRYKKVHKSQEVIQFCLDSLPRVSYNSPQDFVQVMPEKYISSNPVQSYRNYYVNEKVHLASWKFRDPPKWW